MIRRFPSGASIAVVGIVLTFWPGPAVLAASAQTPVGATAATNAGAASPLAPFVIQNVTLHDPSTVVKCKDEFWIFYTGRGVPSFHSKDLVKWERGPVVFTNAPGWVAENAPASRLLDYWAPDIARVGGRYLLYYSASSYGTNTSGIGLASNPTLDPGDPGYHWTDEGLVIKSGANDDFNTIDPAIFHDADDTLWLSFGSFWSGILMIQLDRDSGRRITPDYRVLSLAYSDSIEADATWRRGSVLAIIPLRWNADGWPELELPR